MTKDPLDMIMRIDTLLREISIEIETSQQREQELATDLDVLRNYCLKLEQENDRLRCGATSAVSRIDTALYDLRETIGRNEKPTRKKDGKS